MAASGESRYSIAKATGISQAALSRFASGEYPLRGRNVDKLAEHLALVLVKKKRGKNARKEAI
jgi:predicted transcriptional regulator